MSESIFTSDEQKALEELAHQRGFYPINLNKVKRPETAFRGYIIRFIKHGSETAMPSAAKAAAIV